MLSPLSLPCLPNDEVVITMMSSASVCKIAKLHFYVIFFSSIMSKTTANKTTLVEAEWRLSENDHDHHKRRHHHHHHHHHHHCWFGPMHFLSIHRRKGSYLVYLINCTIFLYIWRFFVLLSSAGLFPWCSNGPTIQSHSIQSSVRSKAFYSHLQKQLFLVTRFREKK